MRRNDWLCDLCGNSEPGRGRDVELPDWWAKYLRQGDPDKHYCKDCGGEIANAIRALKASKP